MHLVEFPLLTTSCIPLQLVGHFSGIKTQQEIVVIRGSSEIEILNCDTESGKLCSLIRKNLFGVVRSIQPIRLLGSSKDYIAVCTDSGRIAILEFIPENPSIEILALETFGRSGCRRTVPGQYLAVDPLGRAVFIASIERSKFSYLLNSDKAAKLTISSPLDCHKSHIMVHQVISLDVGFENPIFISLESFLQTSGQDPLPEAEKMLLVYYELDLGLNNLIRKSQVPVDHSTHFLLSLPGTYPGSSGPNGPGGLLAFSLDEISWFSANIKIPMFKMKFQMRGNLLTAALLRKSKSSFFVLFQLESGDLFKLDLVFHEQIVTDIQVKYFDHIQPVQSFSFLKTGFLVCGTEQGNNLVYQVLGLADDEEQVWNASSPSDKIFLTRPDLKNLNLVDQEPSLLPTIDAKVVHSAGDEFPTILTCSGTTAVNSRLVALRYGLEVSELAVTELPLGTPVGVWTLSRDTNGRFSAIGQTHYIIVSFSSSTSTLVVDETVEEDPTAPFSLSDGSTIHLAPLVDGSVIQITTKSIRHINGSGTLLLDWDLTRHSKTSNLISIAASNYNQVLIATNDYHLILFHLDAHGKLVENPIRKQLENQVGSIALSGNPWFSPTQVELTLAAVCTEGDQIIRLFTITTNGLELVALQALQSGGIVNSLAFIKDKDLTVGERTDLNLLLYAGLSNGILIRFTVEGNALAGYALSDSRQRFIGPSDLKLFLLPLMQNLQRENSASLVLLASRPWLLVSCIGKGEPASRFFPINYLKLSHAAVFCSESAFGLLGVSGCTLRIVTFDRPISGSTFPAALQPYMNISVPSTPTRLLLIEPEVHGLSSFPSPIIMVICSELKKKPLFVDAVLEGHMDGSMHENDANVSTHQNHAIHNTEINCEAANLWVSSLNFYDFSTGELKFSLQTDCEDEAIFCASLLKFHGNSQLYLAVGTGINVSKLPLSFDSAWIYIYEWNNVSGSEFTLNFIHKTQVEDLPASFCSFRGRLLVGMGPILRLYDLGKKKLLRKSENRSFPFRIHSISLPGSPTYPQLVESSLTNPLVSRVIVSDVQFSVIIVTYKPEDNSFYMIADDPLPRWPSCPHLSLDYDTVALADKFGTLSILRLPLAVSESIDSDSSGARLIDRSHLLGAPNKIENICHAHIGDTITSLNKALLRWSSGREVLLCTTITGAIIAMVPLMTKEDVNFFQRLEMLIRSSYKFLTGREHFSYRSAFAPTKHIIDGSLLKQFHHLPPPDKQSIASELGFPSAAISRRVEELQLTFLF